MSKAAKFWTALVLGMVTAGLVVLEAALGDGVITPIEWVQIISAMIATPAAVYTIPNTAP